MTGGHQIEKAAELTPGNFGGAGCNTVVRVAVLSIDG